MPPRAANEIMNTLNSYLGTLTRMFGIEYLPFLCPSLKTAGTDKSDKSHRHRQDKTIRPPIVLLSSGPYNAGRSFSHYSSSRGKANHDDDK